MTVAPGLPLTATCDAFSARHDPTIPDPSGDPDRVSVPLRESHQLLWSKVLPDGRLLQLSTPNWSAYLRVASLEGRWTLGSDNFATTHANALPTVSPGARWFRGGARL